MHDEPRKAVGGDQVVDEAVADPAGRLAGDFLAREVEGVQVDDGAVEGQLALFAPLEHVEELLLLNDAFL